ncbi:isocitrate lyase/PEP mutase family protein [Pseudoteredinibacter isoporae]|uniref:2-methylisocitrate lyase-like PEP mutase family enzyme n=1 Tax=Pseudoteredinibacter isoporae TaxID=570281 RepID=A0A7X0JU30_9GAMM|nr:isocitrate lyase/phosphoenolpyruvate mutase family protein [Pseudoteredinibacter isoporae]MBB6522172.1 2-methylisocitrate lyase-like PEP mutase family enzyme [Pseudoteredinibacter isoporae]NHO87707.1 isocitrate lyase/phosphoenolpyruvate mutase family protein [Pseudoteredinibacter isoporae]NIB23962.1 isocitrate lyase/phosphoenolpyruvate mutase family protein [Pseudoteredinibacter isoporae]
MNQENVEIFRKLHKRSDGLVLSNVWDCASAVLVQHGGANAIATSSASLAWANGYPDGGALPVEQLLRSVENIMRIAVVPVSIDIEAGYSDQPEQVVDLLVELVKLGVAGINIEDGQDSPDLFSTKLEAIRETLGPDQMFINARTDVYLQSLVPEAHQLQETQQRIARYASAGADSAFVPGLLDLEDIKVLLSSSALPLNIMLPSLELETKDFFEAGVKRLSYGPGTFLESYRQLQSFSGKGADSGVLSYDGFNRMLT